MIILDGGLGRELQAMGAPFRQPEWSALALMEGPDYVRAAHDAFLRAGADICLLYTSPSPRDATLSRMPSSA